VTQCADPGGTSLGDKLRTLLLNDRQPLSMRAEVLLFMASRAELVERVIGPALASGAAVITDRFLLSNVVYQGRAGGLDPEELWRLGLFAAAGVQPDLSIVLDLPVDLSSARRKARADRVEERPPAYHEAVRQGFLAEARARPDRICVVDASQSVEAVSADILREVKRVLEARARA
jgi:dTMP kinase